MKDSSSAGHVNQEYLARRAGKKNEKRMVRMPPPIKPSQVLLGDSARKGVLMNFLPIVIPQK